MGLMMRRRPLVRLAAGAAVAGTAYHYGKKSERQAQINEEAQAAYAATQPAPAPAYVPPTPPAATGTTDLNRLVELHSSGALTDEEFAAAKAQLLGM